MQKVVSFKLLATVVAVISVLAIAVGLQLNHDSGTAQADNGEITNILGSFPSDAALGSDNSLPFYVKCDSVFSTSCTVEVVMTASIGGSSTVIATDSYTISDTNNGSELAPILSDAAIAQLRQDGTLQVEGCASTSDLSGSSCDTITLTDSSGGGGGSGGGSNGSSGSSGGGSDGSSGGSGGGGSTEESFTLSVSKKQKLRSGKIVAKVKNSSAEELTGTLTVTVKGKSLATSSVKTPAGKTKTYKLKLSKKGKKQVKSKGKLKAKVCLVTAAGTESCKNTTIRK